MASLIRLFTIFLWLGVGLQTATLLAQATPKASTSSRYFEDVSFTHLPIMVLQGRSMDAKPFDADGDGDLDILIANEHAFNILLINDGKGHFTDESVQRLPLNKRDSEDIAVADFDGDGDLDVIVVSEDDQLNEYYLNDGTGHFKDISDRLPVTDTSNGVLTIDVNNDGHPDLIIGNAGQNRLLINDGQGGWIDDTEKRLPQSEKTTQDVEAGDIDGDGDLDLIFGNEDDSELLINNGKGVFQDETKGRLPIVAGQWETREADFGDIDGDGDLDLFLANVNFRQNKDAQNRLLINDGKGFFTDQTEALLPAEKMHTVDGDFADIDGDGDLDIITGSGFGSSYNAYFTDDSGKLRLASAEVFPPSSVGDGIDLEMADFNGDGHADLYLCNFLGHDFLLFGKGMSVNKLIDLHAEAMGGRERWRNMRSYALYQTRENGMEIEAYAEKPDKFKLVFRTKDQERIKSYDGEKGWLTNNGEYEAMRPGEAIEMAEEPEFYEELIFALENGHKVDYLGTEKLDGVLTYKIKMTKSGTDEQLYWLNAETYLIELTGEYSEDSAHEGIYYKTRFKDYRSVDGAQFPFLLELIPNDGTPIVMNYHRIETNVTFPKGFFSYKQK